MKIIEKLKQKINSLCKTPSGPIENVKRDLKNSLTYFIPKVEQCESLYDLYEVHVRLWDAGIQHPNFGPNKFGMFRTDDISTMKPEEVYLGGVYGLWTKPLPEWDFQEDKKLVIFQYKYLLLSNLKWMLENLK